MKIKQTLVYGKIQQGAKTKLSKSTVALHPILAQLLLVVFSAAEPTPLSNQLAGFVGYQLFEGHF